LDNVKLFQIGEYCPNLSTVSKEQGLFKKAHGPPAQPVHAKGTTCLREAAPAKAGNALADPAPSRGHAFSTALDKEQWPCWPFPGSDRLLMVSPDIILWVKGGQRLLSWLKLERFRFCDTTFYFLLYLIDLLPRFLNAFISSSFHCPYCLTSPFDIEPKLSHRVMHESSRTK